MTHTFGITPHFTIVVLARDVTPAQRWLEEQGFKKYPPRPVAEIEVDTDEDGPLEIRGHHGLRFVNQKMLTAGVG